jgi:hypothetical protein
LLCFQLQVALFVDSRVKLLAALEVDLVSRLSRLLLALVIFRCFFQVFDVPTQVFLLV